MRIFKIDIVFISDVVKTLGNENFWIYVMCVCICVILYGLQYKYMQTYCIYVLYINIFIRIIIHNKDRIP